MTTQKLQPEYLKPGDEVAIISPSFFIDEEKIVEAVTLMDKWGLKVHIGKNALKRNGTFAGSDEERLSDLQEATSDPGIKAVICSRGGYGVSRIISKVDFSPLKKYPKWYVGFSDITVLHMWLSEVCGVISVHGEMPLNFNKSRSSGNALTSLQQALFGNLQPCVWEGQFYNSGKVTGEMTGGNLSLIYSLLGTPAEPQTDGKILFLEETGEYYYHIDRMLTSLKLAGKLERLSAMVIGGMNDLVDSKIQWSMSIEDTILGIIHEYSYPIFFNFPAGHVSDNRAFYVGKQMRIDVSGNQAILTSVD